MPETSADFTLWALDPERKYRSRELPYIRSRQKIGVSAAIQIDMAAVIKYEAASRGLSTAELVRNILEAVADDDLFGAVLDR